MRDPLSRSFASLHFSGDSWFLRVRENLGQFLTRRPFLPSSANGAPIHLPKWDKSEGHGRAQSTSVITHAAILCALVFVAIHPPGPPLDPPPSGKRAPSLLPLPTRLLESLRGNHLSGGTGSGSGHDLLPPNQGNLPPRSRIQLVKPTLPQNPHPELPIPPTILDPSAARVLTPVDNIGLPWMPDPNGSSGRGKGNTIGDGTGDSMGNTPGDGVGVGGPRGPYHPGGTEAKCAYCPDPQYTDEAREAKLQGAVTLLVLVGADGRAEQVRIVKGIGLGLDERAAQTIRTWKFVPAYDAARHAVPTWVTIEAIFRLF
jgi:TonB family protein